MLSNFHSRVNVRARIVTASKFENVSVESRHLRLDVIKKIGLLHMITVNSDWDLLEEFLDSESSSLNSLLNKSFFRSHQSCAGFHRKAVGMKGLHSIVALANIVNNKYRVLEFFAALD